MTAIQAHTCTDWACRRDEDEAAALHTYMWCPLDSYKHCQMPADVTAFVPAPAAAVEHET